MSASETRAGRTREKILQAALGLFQSQGIKRVTINDVAAKAGVTPATVYNQFGNKDNLVYECVRGWYAEAINDYLDVITADRPFNEKMENLISYKSGAAEKLHAEFTMMASSDIPEIREYVQNLHMARVMPAIDTFFEEGRQQGYVDPNLSTQAIIRFTELIRKGLQADNQNYSDPDYTRKLVKEITPLMLYGILGKTKQGDSGKVEKE